MSQSSTRYPIRRDTGVSAFLWRSESKRLPECIMFDKQNRAKSLLLTLNNFVSFYLFHLICPSINALWYCITHHPIQLLSTVFPTYFELHIYHALSIKLNSCYWPFVWGAGLWWGKRWNGEKGGGMERERRDSGEKRWRAGRTRRGGVLEGGEGIEGRRNKRMRAEGESLRVNVKDTHKKVCYCRLRKTVRVRRRVRYAHHIEWVRSCTI